MLRNLTLIIIFFVITNIISFCAEFPLDTNHQETLFDGKGYSSGGYGGLEFKGTSIKDRAALLVGGRGGWIISNTFSIGLGLYGLTTTHEVYRDKSPNYLF